MNNLDKHTNWRPNTGEPPEFHDQVEEYDILFKDGSYDYTSDEYPLESWVWDVDTPYNIVAYRVLKWKEEPKFKVGDTVVHVELGRILGKVVSVDKGSVEVQWACGLLLGDKSGLGICGLSYEQKELKKVEVVLKDV